MPVISQSARSRRQSSSSAPCAVASGCSGCSPLEPRQRRDGLGDLRVVLHRARAQRVEAGVHAVVHLRQAGVVADQVDLGDLGQRGIGPAPSVLGSRRPRERPAARTRTRGGPGRDRSTIVPVPRRRALTCGSARPTHARAPPRTPARTVDLVTDRRSVTATTRASRPAASRARPPGTRARSARRAPSAAGRGRRNDELLEERSTRGTQVDVRAIAVSRSAVYAAFDAHCRPSSARPSGPSQPR